MGMELQRPVRPANITQATEQGRTILAAKDGVDRLVDGAIGIVRSIPEPRAHISIGSHDDGPIFSEAIHVLEILGKKVSLVSQNNANRRGGPNTPATSGEQDHPAIEQIKNRTRALVTQDPKMRRAAARACRGNVIVDFI